MSQTTSKKCRCCREERELLNLWDKYCRFGEFITYGDMIEECFSLCLQKPSDGKDFICQECVVHLNDAVSFKKQILKSNTLLNTFNDNGYEEKKTNLDATSDTETEVKTEYLDIEYLLDDECDNISDAVFSDDDKTVPVIDEKKITIKKCTTEYTQEDVDRCTKEVEQNNTSIDDAATMFNVPPVVVKDALDVPVIDEKKITIKKCTTEYTQEDVDRCIKEVEQNNTSIDDAATMFNVPPVVVKDALDEIKTVTTRKKGRPLSDRATHLREQQLVLNLITEHSNATPLKCYNGRAYECYFCENPYENPADLKKHTLKVHKGMKLKINRVFTNAAKMDVTDLTCRLCHTNVNVISDFCDHLKSEHNKKFYSSVLNFLIPFNFCSDELKCVICEEKFLYFKLLNEHMKKHFINFECDRCGVGFITRGTLKSHKLRHENGEFKCDYCPKIFLNKGRVREHINQVHLKVKRNKCCFCQEKFVDMSKKKDHETEVHGAKKLTFKCQACERIFKTQKSLSFHVKDYHLMIRRHKCSVCDKQFPNPLALKEHNVKHTKSRDFICGVCNKGFGRRYTLTEHMRIHTNDRRHKCEVCNEAFIQKCSLKSHMASKHYVYL